MASTEGRHEPSIPPFHVHRGHGFAGFELIASPDEGELLVAMCECGARLDAAPPRFTTCPECGGRRPACARCAGTGRVIDHAALQWRVWRGESA